MIIYEWARRAKHVFKEYKKSRDCVFLSPVRRIERVYPPNGRRVVAMTFDDGPTDIETNPKVSDFGLTEHLLRTLEKFGARGTFDVIGTTEFNYPDEAGVHGSFSWGGVKYDHYPDINRDMHAGAKNRPDLVARILAGGHEVTNHGYRHILFGKMKLVYGARECFGNIHEVISDIMELDRLLLENHGYKMRLSRPPHYVDKIPDGKTSYDAYRYAGYNYMAASFDGGGWLPSSGDFIRDTEAMVEPLRRALEADADALNGQIIFQKDGYSMSRHTPVADALPLQLEILKEYGYEVVTVSELLAMSSFSDAPDENATALANAGYTVGYRNNMLKPNRILTFGELVAMSADPKKTLENYRKYVDSDYSDASLCTDGAKAYGVEPTHPYFIEFCTMAELGILDIKNPMRLKPTTPVTSEIFAKYMRALAPGYEFVMTARTLTRKDSFAHLKNALLK